MNRRVIVIAAAIALFAAYFLWDYLTVDRCLDRGGAWIDGRCVEYGPYPPQASR